MPESAILLIHCPDRKGIVAGISGFLYAQGANILHADQHQDNDLGLFFMSIEWDLAGFALDDAAFRQRFQPLADSFQMEWRLAYSAPGAPDSALLRQGRHLRLAGRFGL
jgi:formyltetrahydrofolate deformylase